MSKRIKKSVLISILIVVIIIAIIATFFIVKSFKEKSAIRNVKELYSTENIQDRLSNTESFTKDDFLLKIDDEDVIGVIKIDRINFEGLIYEGTSLDTLSKGVGHFESSPYLAGNVCLAAHNTDKFWAKLHTLQVGDKITYMSFLGTKEYQVINLEHIYETDWSKLENTNDNVLTLITCVKGNKPLRLCVQALEV